MSGIGNNQPIRAQSSREERAKAQKEARDLRAASRASQREIPQPSQMTRVDDSVPRDMGESQHVEQEDHTQELEISPMARVQFNFGSLLLRLPGHLSKSHPTTAFQDKDSLTMLLKEQNHDSQLVQSMF